MKIFTIKSLIAISFVILFAGIITVSCTKKKTECTAVITVKKLLDTMQTVSFSRVIIAPEYPDVRVEGKSDASGVFSYVFKYEGILTVVAVKEIVPATDSIRGKTVIRLKPGETVYKTVFLN
jgi:hypothetical protein